MLDVGAVICSLSALTSAHTIYAAYKSYMKMQTVSSRVAPLALVYVYGSIYQINDKEVDLVSLWLAALHLADKILHDEYNDLKDLVKTLWQGALKMSDKVLDDAYDDEFRSFVDELVWDMSDITVNDVVAAEAAILKALDFHLIVKDEHELAWLCLQAQWHLRFGPK